jgi:hypothetical protein
MSDQMYFHISLPVVNGKIDPKKDLSSFAVNEVVVEILSAAKESAKTGKTIFLGK